jgi:hypothetical protein
LHECAIDPFLTAAFHGLSALVPNLPIAKATSNRS